MTVEDAAFWKLQTIARMAALTAAAYETKNDHMLNCADYADEAIELYDACEAALTPKESET